MLLTISVLSLVIIGLSDAFTGLDKINDECSLNIIQEAMGSCSVTNIDVYSDTSAPGGDGGFKSWLSQFSVAAAGSAGVLVGGPGATIIANGAKAIIAGSIATSGSPATDPLQIKFQAAINYEFQKLQDCITEKDYLNNAREDVNELGAFAQKYEELAKATSVTSFNTDITKLYSDVRTFILKNFGAGKNVQTNFEASAYSPIWQSTLKFYITLFQQYLISIGCDVINTPYKTRTTNWQSRCQTYNDKRALGISDINLLSTWIEKARWTIYGAYKPSIQNQMCTNDILSCSYSWYDDQWNDWNKGLYAVTLGWSGWNNGDPFIVGNTADDFDFNDDFKSYAIMSAGDNDDKRLRCSVGTINCKSSKKTEIKGAFTYHYEIADSNCCSNIQSLCKSSITKLEDSIWAWKANYEKKYISKINTFKANVASEIVVACTNTLACGPNRPQLITLNMYAFTGTYTITSQNFNGKSVYKYVDPTNPTLNVYLYWSSQNYWTNYYSLSNDASFGTCNKDDLFECPWFRLCTEKPYRSVWEPTGQIWQETGAMIYKDAYSSFDKYLIKLGNGYGWVTNSKIEGTIDYNYQCQENRIGYCDGINYCKGNEDFKNYDPRLSANQE